MLQVAFKEWAVVNKAIAEGQQSVLLRKGGIAEVGGEFRPEHRRFWLYPTYFHERQQHALRSEKVHLLETVEAERPPEGILKIDTLVKVTHVEYVTDLKTLLTLEEYHIGTEEMIRARFHYRKPGVYLHFVRAYRLPEPAYIPESPEYAGCKTWVELETPILADSAVPVLSSEEYRAMESKFLRKVCKVTQ